MTIDYYLTKRKKNNVFCRMTDGKQKVTISLQHSISNKSDMDEEELPYDHLYFFTLKDLSGYLEQRFEELKSEGKENCLEILKDEVTSMIAASGIDGIARLMFDRENEKDGVFKFDAFIKAFEMSKGLQKGEYNIECIGNIIHFHREDGTVYEVDTEEGLTSRLKWMFEKGPRAGLYEDTQEVVWMDLYQRTKKSIFLPILLGKWERYWQREYRNAKEDGRDEIERLDNSKAVSWRQFQLLSICYDDEGVEPIPFALQLSTEMYELCVMTMLSEQDADRCYERYCKHVFHLDLNEVWETIELQVDLGRKPVFFIREYQE